MLKKKKVNHGKTAPFDSYLSLDKWPFQTEYEAHLITVLSAKSDSDAVFCLQLLSKTLTCKLHFS